MSKEAINVEAIYPLTPMQQGLLFHSLYDPKSKAYFIQFGYALSGQFNVEAFKLAWQRVIDRHPVLRTLFVWEHKDKIVQVVRKHVQLPWREQDWSGVTPEEQETRWRSFLSQDREQGFNIARAPLIRLTLIRLNEENYRFVLDFHHLVLDGWSVTLIVKELFGFYRAFIQGAELELPPPRPYRDYINWLQQQDLSAAEQFWRRTLAGIQSPTTLLSEQSTEQRERAVEQYCETEVGLSAEASSRLLNWRRRQQLTLNTIVQGAWALLLSRYNSTEEVVFGTVVSGRPPELAGVEEMVGLFINTLPVRVKVDEAEELVEWLRRLQEQQVEMRRYEYTPFSLVQRCSQISAELPLFESIYAFESKRADTFSETSIDELRFELINSTTLTSYPLTLVANSRPDLSLYVSYDSTRFEKETIERMLGHLRTILTAMPADSRRSLSSLPLLTAEENRQILSEWNQTQQNYASPRCVHHLFEAQVERHPQRVAVTCKGEEFSYGELNRMANQFAHYLQNLGVGPEVMVGILMDRSPKMVVALLGILKAGGAYVPLDPSYPIERLAYIIEDARMPVLVTQEHLADKIPTSWAQVLFLDTDWEEIRKEPEHNTQSAVEDEHLTYAIYTSGSTGRPKGVMVTHRGVVNYLNWCTREYRVTEDGGSAVHSPLGFDLTITSLLSPLAVGGRVELLAEEQGIEGLSAALRGGHDYSLIKLTPSHLDALSHLLSPEDVLQSTRALIIGGEALWSQSLNFWRHAAPAMRLINEYGPTETVVGCCVYEVAADDPTSGAVPIGRPIANTQLYILNASFQPLPVGVVGELYVGGAGVARGYLGQPALTARNFIPNPFSSEAGARIYRTGDLARYLPDGKIDYLGRLDHQVKVRGYRVEPGEIEAVLGQHPAIKEAVVLAREDQPGQKRLVAYLVAEEKIQTTLSDKALYRLPNDLQITQLNKNETDFIYKEIFEDETYLKHGITFRADDCVFDVGANIGLFTLFVHQRCRNPQVYAFEPIPTTFNILRKNASLYGLNTKLFDCALSNVSGASTFTFYPRMSVMSGAYADATEDEALARLALRNQKAILNEYADDLMSGRFASETFTCRLRTISEIISEYEIERIDLLKVDVEKSELDVLKGIARDDWQKIRQLVIEVHDLNGRLDEITLLLEQHGYRVSVDQDAVVRQTNLFNVYAIHPSRIETSASEAQSENSNGLSIQSRPELSSSTLREYLHEKLPEYMIPHSFITLASLPLTTNGKIDRQALPAPESVNSEATARRPPETVKERLLAEIWREVLRLDEVSVEDNFFELGGDSILSIQIIVRANRAGLQLAPKQLFDYPTIAELANAAGQGQSTNAQQELITGAVELTPVQHWFFELDLPHREHFNQAALLLIRPEIEIETLRKALAHLLLHHDALRLRFRESVGGWEADNDGEPELSFETVSLSHIKEQKLRRSVIEAEAELVQASLNLSAGPLMRAVYFDCGSEESGRLLLVIHHLAVDGVSWRILLEDLQRGYEQLSAGESIELGAKTTSFKQWAALLKQQAQSEQVRAQMDYWSSQSWQQAVSLPGEAGLGELRNSSLQTISETLSGEQTSALLQEVPEAYHTQIMEVLLTALGRALGQWLGEGAVVVDAEGHGREEIVEGVDLSRTVGWFTAIFPVLLRTSASEEIGEGLKRVKEQLRGMPQKGIGYGMLRYLSEDESVRRRMRRIPRAQVNFNYLGQFDQVSEEGWLKGAEESSGRSENEEGKLRYPLQVNSLVRSGKLETYWTYSQEAYEEESIRGVADYYQESLEEIISHCASGAGGFTPSDFPFAKLDQEKLGKLTAMLGKRVEKR